MTNKEKIEEAYQFDSYIHLLVDKGKTEGLTYEQTLELMVVCLLQELRFIEDKLSQELYETMGDLSCTTVKSA